MSISPTVEGFRAAFRQPSLTLAEISWRWAMGATATALFFFGLFEYLNTLPVTKGELFFLRSRQPYLVGQAIAHILRGSLPRAVIAALLAALLLGLLWIIAASLGRIVTVRSLLDHFASRKEATAHVSAVAPAKGGEGDEGHIASNVPTNSFQALTRLNFLRITLAIAAMFGLVGAAILAGFASPDAHPRPGLAFLLFLPLAGLIWLAWSGLNWLLSLAGIFAVRDGEDAIGAISTAAAFCRERSRAVFAVSTWTGLAHLVTFVAASTVVSMPLGFAGLLPWRLVLFGVILVTLAYFALADWLYMARLAGYVCIADMPDALLAPLPPVMPTPPAIVAPAIQSTIDRDEPILSDMPNPSVEK